MGESTPNSIWIAGQTFLVTIAWAAICMFITITAGCSAETGRRAAAEPPNARPAQMPDESQLQIPPLRFSGLAPADPQPTDDSLRPGLSVVYYYGYFKRHLDPLADIAAVSGRGLPGKPIPYLNHRFGKQEVFDSGTNRGVAMRMKGLIRFPQPGEYAFRAISNDGLRIRIGDAMIIDDPTQHSDRYAVQAIVSISQAGWYPLTVAYFQRKGTASIALLWRRPQAKDFATVPAESFAHLP